MDRVEQVVGHSFVDRSLLEIASDTTRRGFGALEHLGDAIADLAVAVACWRAGEAPELSAALVSNDALDGEFERRLGGLVRARSGDVIEALIGAVHLDAGFEPAAASAVRLCGGGHVWVTLPQRSLGELLPAELDVFPPWLGALAIDAVVADALMRREGLAHATQRVLSTTRASMTSRATLRRVAAGLPDSVVPAGADPVAALRSAVVATLLGAGWPAASGLVARLLVDDMP